MEKLPEFIWENLETRWELDFQLTRTHLFVRQILWKLSYEELIDILSNARKNN